MGASIFMEQRETSSEPCVFLRIELKNKQRYLLPYGSLISVWFKPESDSDKRDQIKLTFASHDVTVLGFNLAELLDSFEKTTRRVIAESNSSTANFQKTPGITSIIVEDKAETAKKAKPGAKA
jgi:hypothetical protein